LLIAKFAGSNGFGLNALESIGDSHLKSAMSASQRGSITITLNYLDANLIWTTMFSCPWSQDGRQWRSPRNEAVNRSRHGDIAPVRRQANQRVTRWSRTIVLAAMFPALAWGQIHAMPYADTAYQYNSNIFALSSSAPEPIGSHGPTFSDHYLEERAGVDALYDWSLQELYANVEGRHFGYDRLSDLSHDEYLVHGGIKWHIGYLFDGVLDYRRERSMVQFQDFTGTNLYLQTQSVTTASGHFQFTPNWQLETQGVINDLDSPRPGYPDLSLTEDSIQGGIRYVGLAKLSAGVDAIFLKGHFNGDEFVITPRYTQTTLEATAKYVATGLSSFDGAIGYTRRMEEDAATIGGATGLLAYQRELSSLTSINLKLLRAVNSYVTYGSTEIDTGVALGATWNATAKIAVTPGYQWTYSTFPGANLAASAPVGTERVDHYQLALLGAKYQARNWLSLRLYGQYETRHSDVGIDSFNRTLYGLEFEVRLASEANQHYQLNLPE
jgi:hypothetical protein